MEVEYYSCKKCGSVFDLVVMKKNDDKQVEDMENNIITEEEYETNRKYKDYYDFLDVVCPVCKYENRVD